MTGQRSASLLLVLLLGAAITASPPGEECPPASPYPLHPMAAPPPIVASPRQPFQRPPSADTLVPSVSIRVRVPSEAAAGKELTYKIIAENSSQASAHHVTVRVTIPGSAARLVRASPAPTETSPVFVWKLDTLAPRARREITLIVLPTGDEEVSCCARVQFEHGQCVRTGVGKGAAAPPPTESTPPSPPLTRTPPLNPVPPPSKAPPVEKKSSEPEPVAELEVRKSGPTEGAQFDILAYRLEVRNVGRANARKVLLRERLAKGIELTESHPNETSKSPLTWELGDIAPGGSRVVRYKLIPDKTGSLTSTVSVEAEGVAKREVQHTVRVGQPALAVTMTGPKSRGVGRDTTYHLTVTNTGDMAATNVQLHDELTADLQFVRASASGQLTGSQVAWNLGTIAAGARRTVQLVLRARRAGTLRNVCTATADRGLKEQGKAETVFTPPAGLAVEIDPERDVVEMDKPFQIIVRAYNAGRLNESNVAAKVTLPDGLRLLDVPGHKGHELKGATLTLPKRPLAAGKDAQVILSVQGEKAGPMKLAVELTSDAVTPDKAVKADATITVLPAPTTSRKTSSW